MEGKGRRKVWKKRDEGVRGRVSSRKKRKERK